MQRCTLAVCSHEAWHSKFLPSLETLGATRMSVTMSMWFLNVNLLVFLFSCRTAQLKQDPVLKQVVVPGLCLNCFLPLNSNTQTRYLLNRKKNLCYVLQVLPIHVCAYFLDIPFLSLGSRLEWEGSYVWILDFGLFVYTVLGSKMKGGLRSGWSETCGNCSFCSSLCIFCKSSLW